MIVVVVVIVGDGGGGGVFLGGGPNIFGQNLNFFDHFWFCLLTHTYQFEHVHIFNVYCVLKKCASP